MLRLVRRFGGLRVLTLLTLAAAAHAQVRVDQLYASGGATGALYTRDFVQLYNAGAAQSLSGWTLQTSSATGSTWVKAALPALTLLSGERLLVRLAGDGSLTAGQTASLPAHDADHPANLAAAGGKLALCSNNVSLVGAQPVSAAIVDFVGYGSADWREPFVGGSSADNAPPLNDSVALLRRSCGATDSGVNANDFRLALPRPRSRALPSDDGIDFGAYVTPRLARPPGALRVVASPYDCALENGAGAWQFTLDATALGGGFVALRDDGTGGDELAGDALYSASVVLASSTPAGEWALPLTAARGASVSTSVASVVILDAASPAADTCASAELVSGPFPLSRSGLLSGATVESNPLLNSLSSSATMGARRGHWLRVVGTGGELVADTCLTAPVVGVEPPDTVLLVATGACESLSVVGFNDDQLSLCGVGFGPERRSRVTWCSNAGQEYLVWLSVFNAGPSALNYTLSISEGGAPCSGAVGGALCLPDTSAVSYVESEAALGPASNDLCGAASRPELLALGSPARALVGHARAQGLQLDVDAYRFRAAISDVFSARLDAPFRARLELYELAPGGECPLGPLLAGTQLAERCAQPTLSHTLIAGRWYALAVRPQNSDAGGWMGGFEPGGASSAYVLWTELGEAPSNDDCANALALSCSSALMGTTWGATGEPTNLPAFCAGPGAGTSGSFAVEHPGVWYRVAVPGAAGVDDRSVFVETDLVAVDTRLSVFEGNCTALVCVSANDDIDASGRSRVAWRAVAGRDYFVLVHGGSEARGSFEIRAECQPLALGDECFGAPVVSGFAGSTPLTTAGATGAPTNYPLGGASGMAPCIANGGSESSYFDVWRTFVAPCSGQVTISACGALDLVLTLHSACPTLLAPATLACAVGGASSCASLSFQSSESALYWIRVADRDGALGGGAVTLTWSYVDSDGDTTVDCVDGCPLDALKTAPGVCGCGVSDLDSDGDGASDCVDGCPLDAFKLAPGICGCGTPDTDSDADGVANCLDGCPLDPLKTTPGVCGCGVSEADNDGDGAADCVDGCPLDPLKTTPGVCGCGLSEIDSDGDGLEDCLDGCPADPAKTSPGACGCGTADTDSDGDLVADCLDGCPSDPLKSAPGVCGCGTSDVDSDQDTVADCVDNCPALANSTQGDCDLDGSGDACEIASGGELDTDLNGVPDTCELGASVGYCTGGTSSAGCAPVMSGVGTPSASGATAFSILVEPLDAQRFGLVFYGVSGPATIPFGTGTLCVNLPIQRTPVQNTGGPAGTCQGRLSFDWNAYVATHPQALGVPFQSGQLVWSQTWWRDPGSPSGTRVSRALQFTLAP